MKTKDAVTQKIKDVFHQEFGTPMADMKPNANLYSDLGLDSIDAIDLVVRLEVETGLKLKAPELKAIRTFGDVVNIVWEKVQHKSTKK